MCAKKALHIFSGVVIIGGIWWDPDVLFYRDSPIWILNGVFKCSVGINNFVKDAIKILAGVNVILLAGTFLV